MAEVAASFRNLLDSAQGFGTLGSRRFPVCQMTTGGLIFMGVSWAAVLGLSVFCLWRLIQAELHPGCRPG